MKIMLKRSEIKIQKLNNSRPNISRTEYVKKLVDKGYVQNHAEVVFDEINEFMKDQDFSIYPEDDIHEIYGIDGLDDISLFDGICEKLNVPKAEQKDCDELNKKMKIFNAEYILTYTKIADKNTAHNTVYSS